MNSCVSAQLFAPLGVNFTVFNSFAHVLFSKSSDKYEDIYIMMLVALKFWHDNFFLSNENKIHRRKNVYSSAESALRIRECVLVFHGWWWYCWPPSTDCCFRKWRKDSLCAEGSVSAFLALFALLSLQISHSSLSSFHEYSYFP